MDSHADFTQAEEPFALFEAWLAEAAASETNDPEAMTLATVDEAGLPDARMVLCKGVDASGIAFYSNAESAKGRELADHPVAAAATSTPGMLQSFSCALRAMYHQARFPNLRYGASL